MAALFFSGYDKQVKEGIEISSKNVEKAVTALFDGEYLDDCLQILFNEESDYSVMTKAKENFALQSKKISELEEQLKNPELKTPVKVKETDIYKKLQVDYKLLDKTHTSLKKEKETFDAEKLSLEEKVGVWQGKYEAEK